MKQIVRKVGSCLLATTISMVLGGSAAFGGEMAKQIEHAGKERSYLLVVPDKADDKPLPLIVAMHFSPGSGKLMSELSGFSDLALREGFIVAYPDGINGSFDALGCCGNEDDVGFIKAMIERVRAEHNIDAKRIYATGISNGADMSFKVATELPDTFAAIAPVSGGMSGDWMRKKGRNMPTQPTSLIYFYGGKDRLVRLFDAGAKFWAERLSCKVERKTEGGVEVSTGTCADGSRAEIYKLTDMGHSWPGAEGKTLLAYPKAPFMASERIWAFFRDHPQP